MKVKFSDDEETFYITFSRKEYNVAVIMFSAIKTEDEKSLNKLLETVEKLVKLHDDGKPKFTVIDGEKK